MNRNTTEKKFDMYDYIGEGKTIYDVLEKYLHLSVGKSIDYSNLTLIKRFRSYAEEHDENPNFLEKHRSQYVEIMEKLIANLKYALNSNNKINSEVKHIMTDEEKNELLQVLQDAGRKENLQCNSIEEYLEIIGNNPHNLLDPYNNEGTVSEKVIETALSVMSDENVLALRSVLFSQIYLPYVTNGLQQKQKSRVYEHDDEWKEINFISNIMYRTANLKKYDDFVAEYQKEVKEFQTQRAVSKSCQKKRERYVIDALRQGLTTDEIHDAEKRGLTAVIFGEENSPLAEEGTFSWQLNQFKEPKVILDSVARYSERGEENQRVIAISYGKFSYGTLFNPNYQPTILSDEIELLGITKLGKDGNKNYFVLMPFQTATLKKDSDITQVSQKIEIYTNGMKSQIVDNETREILHLVQRERIPEQMQDFYSTVVFSNDYLDSVVEENYRFVGSVEETSNGPKIDASYRTHSYDIDAIKYAQNYSGKIGRKTYSSIEEFIKSTEFFAKHLSYVKALTNGEYTKVENQYKKEEGAR